MKKSIVIWLIVYSSSAWAQSSNKPLSVDSLRRKYNATALTKDPIQKQTLEKELYGLLTTNEEAKWLLAGNIFSRLNKKATGDSVIAELVKKFPGGSFVTHKGRMDAINKLYDEKDLAQMEVLYKEILKNYPPSEALETNHRIWYDYLNAKMGRSYAEVKNFAKALQYANRIESKNWRPEGYAGIAVAFYTAKDTSAGAKFFKRSLDIAEEYISGRNKDDNGGVARSGYLFYVENYTRALLHSKQYAEALKYATILKESNKEVLDKDELVFRSLVGLGRNKEALDIAVDVINAGKGTALMMENLKLLYVKVNGSDKGFGEFNATMKKALAENIRKNLLKAQIKVPAASFSLKDLSGKQVSLNDYKGKVLVLDFWATWCQPCIRSFPAMQMAVDKYANDKDVAFLFIDTYERDKAKYDAAVRKFIADNNYRFQVLFDDFNPQSGMQGLYARAIGVQGIPAKFVIDGNANIRFKLTGFSGSNEAAVEELSQMIEMAKNPY